MDDFGCRKETWDTTAANPNICMDDGYCPDWNTYNYETHTAGVMRRELESEFDVRFSTAGGYWSYDEMTQVKAAFDKLEDYARGSQNVNEVIQGALARSNSSHSFLVFENSTCRGGANACWDRWEDGTIHLSNYAFTADYQNNTERPADMGFDLSTPGGLGLAIQVTILHELGHVMATSDPSAVSLYIGQVSDPYALHQGSSPEENMVTAMALYIATGVQSHSEYQDQLDFAIEFDNLWRPRPAGWP